MIRLRRKTHVLSYCAPALPPGEGRGEGIFKTILYSTRSVKARLLLGCLLSASALADPPRPDDFAFGFPIETAGESALWRLSLPEAVYRDVTRADLGDLRVFDRTGNAVPHTLRRSEALNAEAPPTVDLPFFPLYSAGAGIGGGRSVRIVTNDRGAIIDVAGDGSAPDGAGRITAYLIDASALESIPRTLSLSWEGGTGEGFAVTVSLDSSDELSRWRSLVDKASLADLSFGDAKLTHRDIDLPVRKAKYLRLDWPAELQEVRVTAIRAAFPKERQPPPRHWLKLADATITEEPPGLEFDSGGHWPVDRVRLAFLTRNAVLRSTLESRTRPDAKWRTHYRGLFYRLEHNGAELVGDPVKIAATADPYWRLDPGAKEGWPNGRAPVLELGWVPHDLTFVAQGEPPYTLAFGSAAIGPSTQPVDALLRLIDKKQEPALIQSARVSQRTLLGGEGRLTPPLPPLPWKQWLLWAVLVLGVAFLAWMVRRLMKQLGEGGEKSE